MWQSNDEANLQQYSIPKHLLTKWTPAASKRHTHTHTHTHTTHILTHTNTPHTHTHTHPPTHTHTPHTHSHTNTPHTHTHTTHTHSHTHHTHPHTHTYTHHTLTHTHTHTLTHTHIHWQKANIGIYVIGYAKESVSQNTTTSQYNSITSSALCSAGTDLWVWVLLHYRKKKKRWLHFNISKLLKLSLSHFSSK